MESNDKRKEMQTVEITNIRCPKASDHTDASGDQFTNVWLRERPNGTLFCPVHGDVATYQIALDVLCADCGGRFARNGDPDASDRIAYCEACGEEWHPTDPGYDRLRWGRIEVVGGIAIAAEDMP